MTLDALLAAVLFDEHGDIDRAHSEIPLAQTEGLWHGSAAVYEKTSTGRQAFVANLRASHDLDIEHVAKNKQGKPHAALGLARRREFGAVMNAYRIFTAESITWYGEGDAERVSSLVKTLDFIGKRRANGFGEVAGFKIVPSEVDGVLGFFSEPLRPIPVALYKGDPSALRADAAWRPAYWHPENRAVCYVPDPVTV
jgi:hypothetical protein